MNNEWEENGNQDQQQDGIELDAQIGDGVDIDADANIGGNAGLQVDVNL